MVKFPAGAKRVKLSDSERSQMAYFKSLEYEYPEKVRVVGVCFDCGKPVNEQYESCYRCNSFNRFIMRGNRGVNGYGV